ncbi:hypothetical protein NEOLEDRAFT_1156281 [Neolentinus lepideus HHB14362 ss-1]|uniref:ubiquitinyl hydrolase 1 n=1 Tax=Neolentinus lepideus HHB14362 ss-1 TaxID=1314782 RepID=A0A165SL50_9AGAM|nr:hypothetical protein NEOLEDRAFT_1156281 [Neolentinus lepideus HHB14362 ss-1]
MPGVTVLQPSPALRSFPSTNTMQNVSSRALELTVAEIKDKAKEQSHKASRGVSALSLIKTARSQVGAARVFENAGDLKNALSAYTKAASLTQTFMESAEFQQEALKGHQGVLFKEFMDFQQHEGNKLKEEMQSVEEKLREVERSAAWYVTPALMATDPLQSYSSRSENGATLNGAKDDENGPIQKAGGSIADRIRALQSAGLSDNTTPTVNKRLSRDAINLPPSLPSTPPLSSDSVRNIRATRFPSPPLQLSSSTSASTTYTPAPLSALTLPSLQQSSAASPLSPTSIPQHMFVSPSSLGPPSPSSSTSSSPRASHLNLAEFAQAFPSIDELDESMNGLAISSEPTGGASSSTSSSKLSALDMQPDAPLVSPTAISASSRFPPILPIDPGPRPSSTPIKPSIDTFASRPASPALPSGRLPMSPTVPRKPSNLSLSGSPIAGRSPVLPTSSGSSGHGSAAALEKPDIPRLNAVDPKMLYGYLSGIKVLLLDLRTREAFEKDRIKADAVVCLEPSILQRENVTAESIEDALSIAPHNESMLFVNRDKFELVVFYDDTSETYGLLDSPFNKLLRAIYERAFRKHLKKMPVLLIGGLRAWKSAYPEEVISGGGSGSGMKISTSSSEARSLSMTNGTAVNGLTNGVGGLVSVPATPRAVPEASNYLLSRPRAGTDHTRAAPTESRSPPIPSTQMPVSIGRKRSGTDYQTIAPGNSSIANGAENPAILMPTRLSRKPAMMRPPSSPHIPSSIGRPLYENIPPSSPPLANGTNPIQYPSFSRPTPPAPIAGSSYNTNGNFGVVSPPPQASINPSPLARRRSDYVDQSQEALSGLNGRTSIDYPNLSSQHIIRPPPAAASPGLERQDNRPRLMQHSHSFSVPATNRGPPTAPTINYDYPVTYWADVQIATSGLKNLGNTCYMNSTIQCLSATVPFARFFTDGRWKSAINMVNPMGTKGNLTAAFASILHEMWHGEMPYLSPLQFRRSICTHATQFDGNDQHDSQEFLTFLLDGLHEDLNRIMYKPAIEPSPEQEAELEKLPQQIASAKEWKIYRMRDDSLIVDFFQGQFRNRMECLTCHNTSTTYNTFMSLSLPIPSGRSSSKVTLMQCLDAFVKEEVMENSEAWNCPKCKILRRATKQLSLSRLPPILIIHLKRFSFKGPFTDKIETVVDFPLKNLDLTNYMPPPLPPGVDKSEVNGGQHLSYDDPRLQVPPYKYDLYGVTNHFGSLSSGHYTAFIASRGGWMYCDDSRVATADPKEVVGKPAYVLYYKRIKA